MVLKAKGRLIFRKQRCKRKDGTERIDIKVFVYVPTALWQDSQWPFKREGQPIWILVDTVQGLLIVQAVEEKASNKLERGE